MTEKQIAEKLARIAYSRFVESLDGISASSGQPLPEFDALPERAKAAWMAASISVVIAASAGMAASAGCLAVRTETLYPETSFGGVGTARVVGTSKTLTYSPLQPPAPLPGPPSIPSVSGK